MVDSEDVEASPLLAAAGRAAPFTELAAEGVALEVEAAVGGATADCPGAEPPQAGLEGATEAAREVEAEACADGVVLEGRDSFFEGRLRDSSFSSVDALGFSSRSRQLRELLPRFSSVLRSTRGFWRLLLTVSHDSSSSSTGAAAGAAGAALLVLVEGMGVVAGVGDDKELETAAGECEAEPLGVIVLPVASLVRSA